MAHNAGRFGEWHTPESMFIVTHLENCGSFAGDGDVVAVMDFGYFIAFVKDGYVSIVSKCANTE
jgi:hypothetical protein